MQKAADLNPDDPQIWLLWGNIKRKSNKMTPADEKYQKAYSLSPDNNIILNAYGQTRSRLGDYKFALELLNKAIENEPEKSSKKHEIINRTSIAESLIAWAEFLIRDRDLASAKSKLYSALDECKILIQIDNTDSKSTGMISKTLYKIGKYYGNVNDSIEAERYYLQCIESEYSGFKTSRYKIKSAINLSRILIQEERSEKVRLLLGRFLSGYEALFRQFPELLHEINQILEKAGTLSTYIEGKITYVNPFKEYVIITELDVPNKTYLAHKFDFNPILNSVTRDLTNLKVRFYGKEFMQKGEEKRQAKKIIIIH